MACLWSGESSASVSTGQELLPGMQPELIIESAAGGAGTSIAVATDWAAIKGLVAVGNVEVKGIGHMDKVGQASGTAPWPWWSCFIPHMPQKMALPRSKKLPHVKQHLCLRPMSVGTATNGNGPVMRPGVVPGMNPAGEEAAIIIMLEACCESMELSLSVPMSSTDVLRSLVLDLRTFGS